MDKLNILSTTTIIGDVLKQIGGDRITQTNLLPYGSDPHSFEPTPQDVARIVEADLIFINGVELELNLEPIWESVNAQDKVVDISSGIELLDVDASSGNNVDTEHNDEHSSNDPHVWTDPNNVRGWVDNIVNQLVITDPQNATIYQSNSTTYKSKLIDLDAWIRNQVADIPPPKRLLVTDHQIFGYFAEEYGFTQVGAIIPAYSTLAEPSAQEIAKIEDAIRMLGVKAIFVGNTVNPALAKRIAEDTGTQLIYVYTGSLSEPGDDASTYLDYMMFNVSAITNALR